VQPIENRDTATLHLLSAMSGMIFDPGSRCVGSVHNAGCVCAIDHCEKELKQQEQAVVLTLEGAGTTSAEGAGVWIP
jgi:hypothetical protein